MAVQNNNSTRNRKIGIPDPPDQKKVAITEPSPMVQQMAAKNFALRNGGQMPIQQPVVAPPVPQQNFFGGGNQAIGKFDAIQTGAAPVTDFTNMPKQQEFIPQGNGFANPTLGPVQAPYMKDAADTTPQPQSNFENMPQQPTGWNADGSANYDSLSNALSGYQYPAGDMAGKEFEKNDSDSDGGFASWIKKILPKKRPGRREGETDDEYDRRRTQNMEMVTTLFDAIRHMGNIINTSKGAPLQHFNDPTAMLEQGYQNRKAERAKREALAADQAYKEANLSLKERAAKAKEAYNNLLLNLKRDTQDWKENVDERDFNYNVGQDEIKNQIKLWDQELKEKGFDEKKRHNLISEAIAKIRANKSGSGGGRSGRSGGGSGAKYWFEDKNGKMHYQPNKTMWEQEYYREYGRLPQGESSTSVTTKTTNYKTGEEKTTTIRRKGASVTSQAAQQQNAAKRARNKPKPTSKKTNKKGGWASGLKF